MGKRTDTGLGVR